MFFCPNCSTSIPEDSIICPKCGATVGSIKSSADDDVAVFYASQKMFRQDLNEPEGRKKEAPSGRDQYFIFLVLPIVSMILLKFRYLSVRFYGRELGYSGYEMLGLMGTGRLSSLMISLLIITNILVFITGCVGKSGKLIRKKTLNIIIMVESILYLISTFVTLIHVAILKDEFEDTLAATGTGMGCFLNVLCAVMFAIMTREIWRDVIRSRFRRA